MAEIDALLSTTFSGSGLAGPFFLAGFTFSSNRLSASVNWRFGESFHAGNRAGAARRRLSAVRLGLQKRAARRRSMRSVSGCLHRPHLREPLCVGLLERVGQAAPSGGALGLRRPCTRSFVPNLERNSVELERALATSFVSRNRLLGHLTPRDSVHRRKAQSDPKPTFGPTVPLPGPRSASSSCSRPRLDPHPDMMRRSRNTRGRAAVRNRQPWKTTSLGPAVTTISDSEIERPGRKRECRWTPVDFVRSGAPRLSRSQARVRGPRPPPEPPAPGPRSARGPRSRIR